MMNGVDIEATGFIDSQMIGRSMATCEVAAVMVGFPTISSTL